jgi:hypothetical protein
MERRPLVEDFEKDYAQTAGAGPRRVPPPQRGGAVRGLAEAGAADCNAVREDRGELPDNAAAGDDPTISPGMLTRYGFRTLRDGT